MAGTKDMGKVSDGHHTFDELYEHRHALFLVLMMVQSEHCWFSALHEDESMIEGWFVAGIKLPTGPVTYHLPDRLWINAIDTGAEQRATAPKWDGHSPNDVVERLMNFAALYPPDGIGCDRG